MNESAAFLECREQSTRIFWPGKVWQAILARQAAANEAKRRMAVVKAQPVASPISDCCAIPRHRKTAQLQMIPRHPLRRLYR